MVAATEKTYVSHIVFMLGLLFMVGGALALFAAVLGFSRLHVIAPMLFLIAGAALAFYAIKLRKRAFYLFFACLFLLVGFFLFLLAVKLLPIPLRKAWPLLSTFTGISLIPAGLRGFGKVHAAWLLPAIAFIVLGCILLVFSFGLAPWSFRQFMLDWWPVVVLLAGFTLFFASFVHKPRK